MKGARLAVLRDDGSAVMINARTGLVDETTPTEKELAPMVAETKAEGDMTKWDTWIDNGDEFATLLSLDAGAVSIWQSAASATEPTHSVSVHKVHRFCPSRAISLFAANHEDGSFATAGSGSVIGIWSFSHNRVAVPLHELVVASV
jgi:hypothetical protein